MVEPRGGQDRIEPRRAHGLALIAALAVAPVVTACQRAPTTGPEVPAPPPVDTSALDAYFRAAFPADQPGIAVAISKRGRVVYMAGFGLADLTTRAPITPRTLFNLGSLSKTFVANAILILEERGQLSVDDPLTSYFPGFKHRALSDQVRIRHLLTHTSGLPDLRPVEAQPDFFLTARDAENWYPITQADALEFEPGSRFAYSNPAYNGLALIVEQVSGRKWQDFVRDEIFLPSGMATSTITDGPHPDHGVAHGYVRDGADGTGPLVEYDYGEYPTFAAAGNGGVWSSVEELVRYEAALQAGTFLAPATVAASRTVKTFAGWTSADPPFIGWSWFIRELEGTPIIGHTGGQGGFSTQYFVVPGADVLVVFLMNGPGDFGATTTELLGWLAQHGWLDEPIAHDGHD